MGAKPSKLTDDDVRWIRNVGIKHKVSYNEMARKFGISPGYIYDIVHYNRRENVPGRI